MDGECLEDPKYTLIQTGYQNQEISYPFWLHILFQLLPKTLRLKWKKSYLWRNVPLKKEVILHFGKEGNILTLPFLKSDIMLETESTVRDMLNRIILREAVQNIVVDETLKHFIDPNLLIDGDIIPILMVSQIVEQLCRMKRIPRKEAKIMVFDTMDVCTEFIVNQLYEKFRFITVVTSRLDYFEVLREKIFEENGLLISAISEEYLEEREENIILDFSQEKKYDKNCLNKDSILFDLSGNNNVPTDRNFYNSIEIGDGGELFSLGMLQAIICGQSTWLCKSNLEECKKELDEYQLLIHAITRK